ncbi:MAG: phage N-6-adenine-methyltransferase, partial [Alphaproteobacteria bacterium]|nr:phage N-6-adenine-methyltransferase [Alphaproteobacteria bacterium]
MAGAPLNQTGIGITPMSVIEWIEAKANLKFTLDGCAQKHHARLKRYITPEENFLTTQRDFSNETVWLNPPYTAARKGAPGIADFIARAAQIRLDYNAHFVLLLESNMTGTKYFTQYVGSTPEDRARLNTEIYFYPKRINFLNLRNT